MNRRFIRRNHVDERTASLIAAGSGLAATLGGASPTGTPVADAFVVLLAIGTVVWASASAQWWAVAGAAGVSAVIAMHPITAAIGGLAFLAGLNVGTWRRDQTVTRTLIGGVTMNVLIRSELEGFFGLSALIALAIGVGLFVVGLLRRPTRIRRIAYRGLAGAGGVVALALLTAAVAGVSARPDVTSGTTTARAAIRSLNAGDYDRAAELFDEAATKFDRAAGHLGGVFATPGRLVPALGQNLRAGSNLSSAAAEATAEASAALRQVDPASLRLRGGRIDLDAVRAVEAPLLRVNAALIGLREVVDEIDSSWLIGAVQDELGELNDEFDQNEPRLANAIDAVRLAPQILGEEQPRRYVILFTSPSEARGLGGFVGSYAELEVVDGELDVTKFGRTIMLNDQAAGTDCSTCPSELLLKYGPNGFTTGPNGSVGLVLYSNITMPAHFPNIAEAISVIYPQATGRSVDGVIVADPYTVAALMQYTGPIEVPELDTIVGPDDAAEFILREQYVLAQDQDVRVEALESLASGAILEILRADLPDPPTIARDLGPLIVERRLLMWTTDPSEQTLFDRIGLLGSLPPLDPVDGGFAVTVTNASGNKIDAYLDRTVDVGVEETPDGRRLVADVVLRNGAPSSGLPEYVIGNLVDLPDGYSRLLVTFYGPPSLVDATLDGEPYPTGALPEGGWTAYTNFVVLAPGEERTFRVTFALPPDPGNDPADARPTVWTQPLASRP